MPGEVARLYALVGADGKEFSDKLTAYEGRMKKVGSGPPAKYKVDVDTSKADASLVSLTAKLEGGRNSIAKFASAGSQLALVASILGPEFEQALGPVGQFVRVAGNIGLVTSTIAELGPTAVKSLAAVGTSALGMVTGTTAATAAVVAEGVAADATAVQMGGLAGATDAAAASGLGLWGKLGLLAAVAIPVAAAVGEIRQNDDRLSEAQKKVADGSATMYDRLAAQAAAHHAAAEAAKGDGKIHLDLEGIFGKVTGAVEDYIQAAVKQRHATEMQGIATKVASGYFRQFTTDAGETGAGLDNVAGRAIAAANGLDTFASIEVTDNSGPLSAEAAWLDVVAFKAAVAARNLAALSSAQSAANTAQRARLRGLGEDPGAGVSGSLVGGGGPIVAPYSVTMSPPVPPPSHATRGGGGSRSGGGSSSDGISDAAAKAKQAAEDAADALRDKLARAYDIAKAAAEKTNASMHDGALKGIQSTKDQAYAIAQTTYQLKLEGLESQKTALYEQVNADNAALGFARATRSARDLQESVGDATQSVADAQESLNEARASGDADAIKSAQRALDMANRGLRNAQEAQADAAAQQKVDAEQSAADIAAAGIDAQEKAAADDLTAAQKAADDIYDAQVINENKRYDEQSEALDRAYDLLKEKLENNKTLHSTFNTEILDLYGEYNKKYEAAGHDVAVAIRKGLQSELGGKITLAGPSIEGTAADWKTAAALGPDVAPSAATAVGAGNTTLAAPIVVQNTVIVEGSIVDPNSSLAKDIADQLIVGLSKAVQQQGISASAFFGGKLN